MTCIVGLVDNGKVYIGGDSAGVSGLDIKVRKDSKVFKNGEMVFGFTSSFRMGQILRYSFTPPQHPEGMDDYQYMCTKFITEVIECFKENGYARINNSEVSGGVFLVGYRGRLYSVESDFQVAESLDEYASCGCGSDYALGAIRALNWAGEDVLEYPVKKITCALETAEHFSAGVRGPFKIECI